MIDPFGRTVSYLRVSVTDRCDFRCVYCMPEHMTFLPKADVLSLEELDRLCGAFIRKGVNKLRLTGGEPLVRRDVMKLFRSIGRHLGNGSLKELTLTTNGSQLARFAPELVDCGVKRVNVSVDTLDAEKFRKITRWGDLPKVIAGIDAAQEAGLKVKINVVALRGVNEEEIPELISWAHGRGMEMTLIETMPMGDVDADRTEQYLPLSLVKAQLAKRFTMDSLDDRTGGPARYVRLRETGGGDRKAEGDEYAQQVVFEVARDSNKIEIRRAVQTLFKVTVTDVRTLIVRGKEKRIGRFGGRRPAWKKAFVTLKPGDNIEFFEGV